jgi:hypothetical protein
MRNEKGRMLIDDCEVLIDTGGISERLGFFQESGSGRDGGVAAGEWRSTRQ